MGAPVQRRKRATNPDGSNQLDIRFANDVRPQQPPHPEAPPNFHVPVLASQSGKHEDIQQRPIQSFFNAPPPQHSPPVPPRPPPQQHVQQQAMRTSGQNYDPIRSNYDPVRETVVSHSPYGNPQTSPSHAHSMNRASASPSISSLVDPPNHALTSPSIATQSFYQQQQQQSRLHQTDGPSSVPPSPTINRMGPGAQAELSVAPPPGPVILGSRKPEIFPPMQHGPSTISKKIGPASTATSSTAASPKPHKAKEPKEKDKELFPAPPPLPGSGLMGIGGGGPADGTEFRAPTVILKIPMNGEVNKYINFTRLAEEQYGWDALHPRLAAQRDRLARVAAAGAALERNGSNKDTGDKSRWRTKAWSWAWQSWWTYIRRPRRYSASQWQYSGPSKWSSRTWTRISRWFDNPQAPNHEVRSCPHGTGEAREREDGINGFYAWRVWKHASFGQCS